MLEPEALANDLALMINAAREAGDTILRVARAGAKRWAKDDKSPVTEADLAANAVLEQRLRAARSDYGWLSEESTDNPERLAARAVWVVDPLDGTAAFIKGRTDYCVAIALVVDRAAVLGVVFNPSEDEMFEGGLGLGMRLNGESVSASHVADVAAAHMLGTEEMYRHPAWPEPWPPSMRTSQRNAISYRVALVAAGRFDGVIALSSKAEWDMAPGAALMAGAGGKFTDHVGDGFIFNNPQPRLRSLAAAGSALHPLIVARTRHIRL